MTVLLSVSDPTVLQLTAYNITIAPVNWATAFAVNVSAVDNRVASGLKAAFVQFSTVSADAAFNNLSIPDFLFTVADDETVRLRLSRNTGRSTCHVAYEVTWLTLTVTRVLQRVNCMVSAPCKHMS